MVHCKPDNVLDIAINRMTGVHVRLSLAFQLSSSLPINSVQPRGQLRYSRLDLKTCNYLIIVQHSMLTGLKDL